MMRWMGMLIAGAVLGGAITWWVSTLAGEATVSAGRDHAPASASDPAFAPAPTSAQRSSPWASETRFFVTAYQHLAANDVEDALQTLTSLRTAAERRAAALDLLDVLGYDAEAGARIAAALPAAERDAFLVDRLERLVEHDADDAFFEVMALHGAVQERAAVRVATVWAAVDPLQALTRSDLLPADLQSRFRNAVWGEWARLDPGAASAYLEVAATDLMDAASAATILAASDPEGMLALGDRMPDPHGASLRVAALTELGVRDPAVAQARVRTMAPGPEREVLIMMLSNAMAQTDPEAALAWVDEVGANPQMLRMGIAASLMETDPLRAFDLIADGPPGQEGAMLQSLLLQQLTQESDQALGLATALADRATENDTRVLANLVNAWLPRDPESVLQWLHSRTDLHPRVLATSAANLANRDLALAVSYVERVPEPYRDEWIRRVSIPYAQSDPEAARLWVARFQGQPVYDEVYEAIEQQIARQAVP